MLNLVANGSTTGYTISNSLRFRKSATAYLSRTLSATGNRQIWTWSGWVKRGVLGSFQQLFNFWNTTTANQTGVNIDANDLLTIFGNASSATQINLVTTQVFRDPSAWYHIIVAIDTTQATAANRVKLYVNGTQVTAFGTATYPAQNNNTNANVSGAIGYIGYDTSGSLDGYLAEVNFIDGQALTPSSFGSTNSTTGVWQPAKYTGTYGTNGFYLKFSNIALTSGSNTGLGQDYSGNGNYWNTNNISVTAGTTYDAMTDVPTLTSATASNYPTLSPIDKGSITLSEGNLTASNSNNDPFSRATMAFPASGKYYVELYNSTLTSSGVAFGFGISNSSLLTSSNFALLTNSYNVYGGSNTQFNNNSTVFSTASTVAAGAIMQLAIDMDTGKMWIGKNNVWYDSSGGTTGNPSTGTNQTFTVADLTKQWFPTLSLNFNTASINFGQRPFSYTAPTNYKALNTYNLPASTLLQGNKYMDATLYTGNLTGQSITNAASFKPDLVWIKSRSAATDHKLTDSVRGVTKALISNTTGAETTDLTGLTAFNTNGFTVGASTVYNNTSATYVGWQWQAGQGSTSSNTSGSITSTVSVNTSAGFSIVTYTGTGANATVGHGLGIAPSMIIVKSRGVQSWEVYHASLGNTSYVELNSTNASAANVNRWNNTSPTSTVFSLGNGAQANGSSVAYVAYCWAEIAGFSKISSYTANGSADGAFIYTGFRPKFLLAKMSSLTSQWLMIDTARDPYNVTFNELQANASSAESTANIYYDILSNGFKARTSNMNNSGATVIYAAFAENPFKNALAR